MLYNQVNVKNQRSIQTIRDNTRVIDSFVTRSFPDIVEVRRMLSRTHKESQHFIVTLQSDVARAAHTASVKPFAELVLRGNKLRFTVKPNIQYPELIVDEDVFYQIERIVADFMGGTFAV